MSNKNKIKENKVRVIKFRALSNNTKDWVYGSLIKGNNYDFIITKEDYDNVVAGFDTLVCQCHPIEKDSKTISQFTGLYDKNGKEIYENDIVKAKYIEKRDFGGVKYDNEMEFNELVIWKYQSFQLEIDNCGIKMYRHLNFYEDLNNIKLKEIEVIGNIFDNPELLGEQQ